MGGRNLDQFNARQKSKSGKNTLSSNNKQPNSEAPYTLGAHTENNKD